MIGKTVYVLKEAENWAPYCVQMTIQRKQSIRFGRWSGTFYTGQRTGDKSRESSYWQDDRLGRLIRTKPFPEIPAFSTAEEIAEFRAANRIERLIG